MQFSAVQQQTEAIQHILPWRYAPSTAAPGARHQSARHRGHPPASSRAAPPQAESRPRPARRAPRRRAEPPRPTQAPNRPGSRQSGPDAGNPEMLEFALSQEMARTAPLLPPVEGQEENLLFQFVSGPAGCAPLAHTDLVSRTHFPHDSTSLAHSSEEGHPLSGARHHMAPTYRSMDPPSVAPGWDAADLSGLPPAVVETIIQARAPLTRQTYALKWSLFANWCSSRREDPRRCTIGVVLSFLQERLQHMLSHSTLKVYVAAIAAHHDAVDGRSLGKHDLIGRFLKGARRMNPSRSPLVPSWDLSIVLPRLQRGPFEPLDSVELKFLSLKTALLTALTSIKRVGDLQSFSVNEDCLVFGPVYSHVALRPRPGYVPKVPTTPCCDQVVNLQALPSEEADPSLALLCPVRALCIYVDRTRSFRSSEQLFVC